MAEFTLPKNSKIQKGRHFAAAGAKQPRVFKVYRWNPDDDANPRVDTYEVEAQLSRDERALFKRHGAEIEVREHLERSVVAIETAARETRIPRRVWVRTLAKARICGDRSGQSPEIEDAGSCSENVQDLIRQIQEPDQHPAFRPRRTKR